MRPSLAGKQNIQAKEVDFDTQLKQGKKLAPKTTIWSNGPGKSANNPLTFSIKFRSKCFPLLIYTSLNFLTGLKPSKCPGKKRRGKAKTRYTPDAGYGHVFRFPYDDHSLIVDGKPSGWSHIQARLKEGGYRDIYIYRFPRLTKLNTKEVCLKILTSGTHLNEAIPTLYNRPFYRYGDHIELIRLKK